MLVFPSLEDDFITARSIDLEIEQGGEALGDMGRIVDPETAGNLQVTNCGISEAN